ncbi:nitroreductase family protein [Vallitalea pronyensis]|uniref:Nitroreductase family protein n=1 Tax=Vallitalea pronyensis TaxID=1348613 RepID=A0A8J8MMF8_9FIRM|nr:nitroreductase family protein [Vallitalea pronyensis]QUI24157.1 nitroreductase family protein [Vallitalea pronyensis]
MNTIINTINNRISLRKYRDQDIADKDLDTIIHSAMRAPTAGNMMLYTILVIKDQHTKEQLVKSCDHQPFIAKAPVVLVFLADHQRWYDYYTYCQVKDYCRDNGIDYEEPCEADLLLAASDALIAAQNAVIAAESLNIGSCYIGDIMENYEFHRDLFHLPQWTFPVAMLTLGYYPEDMPRTPRERYAKDYIVFNETYKRLSDEALRDMFAKNDNKISPTNHYHANNFGQFMYGRKTGAEFSKEMRRSVKEALKNWK